MCLYGQLNVGSDHCLVCSVVQYSVVQSSVVQSSAV
jgi:hypothetical protein